MASTDHMQDSHPCGGGWDIWAVQDPNDPNLYHEWNRCQTCQAVSFVYPREGPIPEGMPTSPPGGP